MLVAAGEMQTDVRLQDSELHPLDEGHIVRLQHTAQESYASSIRLTA
jgi:hypothetical protein